MHFIGLHRITQIHTQTQLDRTVRNWSSTQSSTPITHSKGPQASIPSKLTLFTSRSTANSYIPRLAFLPFRNAGPQPKSYGISDDAWACTAFGGFGRSLSVFNMVAKYDSIISVINVLTLALTVVETAWKLYIMFR